MSTEEDQRKWALASMPPWATKVMLESRPVPRISLARMWAHFRLNVHCSLAMHRPVTLSIGNQFYCGCSDCEFYPQPVEE